MEPQPFDALPGVLQHVQSKPLFVMRLNVRPLQIIGATGAAKLDRTQPIA
jgi:ABC-type phosphate/phosphonate transport system permease subunit